MIKYSILIPTCNKDLTDICLKYISNLNKPRDEYEVLVIHNATKDDFTSLIDKYLGKIPNLRYIYENEDGLMASRHRAAKEAKGEVLCYLDDDSFVDKNYLIGIEETFQDENVVCACGPNLPLYESKPPKWLKYFWQDSPWGKWMGELSLMNLYDKIMRVPCWFAFGCNMVLRKDVFFEAGGTNPDCMPPNKLLYTGDGETSLSVKLNDLGYYAIYNPKIKIQHFVSTNRMTESYLVKRAIYQGICDSFSDIRIKNCIISNFDFIPNKNIDVPQIPFFRRKIMKLRRKLDKFRFLKSKPRREYERLAEVYRIELQKSFENHQKAVTEDINLKEWVLRKTFL